jgi:alpha-glucoside transport system substrate-binding protein
VPATQAPVTPAVPKTPTGYAALDAALTQTTTDASGATVPIYSGKAVDIQTQWIGGEGANFTAALADFQKATGITINIEGVGSSHETVLKTRIDGGAPPDLAMLAQPSGVDAYGAAGKLVDLGTALTADEISKLNTEHPATINLLTDGSHIWGIPYKLDVKSTVWYPIKAFAAAGYTVPTTYDELTALEAKIVADHPDGKSNPWCIGMGAGTATGWQATDWLEEVVLKTKGVDFYNDWITHKVTFEDPAIVAAMDNYLAPIFFTPNYVYGGVPAIIATPQTDPMDPMFPPASAGDNWDGFTPGCWMQKQATWYGPDFFPDVKATPGSTSQYILGQDIGIFEFPTIDPTLGQVVEGSGDTLLIPKPADGSAVRPEVLAVAEFLSTPEGTENWIRAGSAISANQSTPNDWYAGQYKLQIAANIVATAKGFGFDASDLMPASVGAGTEWTDLSNWINGGGTNPTTADTLKAIDDSWPTP